MDWVGSTLYGVRNKWYDLNGSGYEDDGDKYKAEIYEINPASGAPSYKFRTPYYYKIFSLAYDGTTLYAGGWDYSNWHLFEIDLINESITSIHEYNSGGGITGMTYYDGKLYGGYGTELFWIDTSNGVQHSIGTGTYNIKGLAVIDGVMYGAGSNNFFTIDMYGQHTPISSSTIYGGHRSIVCSVGDTDSDSDGTSDCKDTCPGFDDNLDADGDTVPDGCDLCLGDDNLDTDGDTVPDGCDLCLGDNASGDTDGDIVCDDVDNCPTTFNPDQADSDGDGVGNVCDMIAHYPFDGNADDISGNLHHGTIYGGATFTADRTGTANGAILLDGVDDYIELPNESAFDLDEFTIAATIKIPDNQAGFIVTKGSGYGNYSLMRKKKWMPTEPYPPILNYLHRTSTGNWSAGNIYEPLLPMNEFLNIAVTLSAAEFKSYVNGELVKTYPNPPPPVFNDDPVIIGASSGWIPMKWFFSGVIDEVRIYNQALSESDIWNIHSIDIDGDCLLNAVDPCPYDADCDDDGLPDGTCSPGEDLNNNGVVDSGETDPLNPDSDGDGIQDGTEMGLAAPVRPEHTDMTVFIPDADPTTTTDPTSPDTDGDGLLDGEEDINKNGAVDNGETSPLLADTDEDGVNDSSDVFPTDPTETTDSDGDGVGDNVDICPGFDDTVDGDGDGVPDGCDICPDNPDDSDGDGVCDSSDICPGFDDSADADGDSVPDGCDICQGDDSSGDTDSDGVCNDTDICPLDISNDADTDGVCPSDGDCDDNDGNNYPGNTEICDGQDNNCNGQVDEVDGDGDGVSDCTDNCPSIANTDQSDVDGDGLGDVCDPCDNRPITGIISPSTDTLWPPNHEMVSVTINSSSLITHNPDTQISITSVGISEYSKKSSGKTAAETNIYGENNFEPDYEITGNLTLNLRSERTGASQGRTYTITVTASDCSDSYDFITQVEVPHDQGN